MMKKIAAVGVLAASLAVAGPASAHDRDGGAIVGALVTSALNPPVAYQAPVYQAPAYQPQVYQQPAYQPQGYQPQVYQQPAYQPPYGAPGYQQAAQYQAGGAYGGQPPSGYCYDGYRRAYVACYAQPQPSVW